ncbi:MAG: hypothetical protein Q4B46_10370, partial [Comamonadaceae bacterium]|nr:hypothetical protein [Comamonadaceae bacterium]
SGTTKECSEFWRTASQTRFFGDFLVANKKVTRLPGRDPASVLKGNSQLKSRAKRAYPISPSSQKYQKLYQTKARIFIEFYQPPIGTSHQN